MTIGEDYVALFQQPGAAPSHDGQPLLVNFSRPGKLLIHFTAMEYLLSAPDAAAARFRYILVVDGHPVLPTFPPIECTPLSTGISLAVTAMPSLEAGMHRVQVIAEGTPGSLSITQNQSLTATGPLD